jgi:hypothetical protein
VVDATADKNTAPNKMPEMKILTKIIGLMADHK